MDWSRRSEETERIDTPESISPRRMAVILRELRAVNRYLGGTVSALAAVTPLLKQLYSKRAAGRLRVADWGTASADIPRALVQWGKRAGVPVQVLALDFNLQACRHAHRALGGFPGVSVVGGDVFRPPFRYGKIDVVMFSAFLHHFTGPQIIALLQGFRDAGVGWATINDLHRSRLAYWGIRLLTAIFSKSPEVQHDGPLSVRKGFRRRELQEIARASGCRQFKIAWRWAFRYSMQIEFETNRPSGV